MGIWRFEGRLWLVLTAVFFTFQKATLGSGSPESAWATSPSGACGFDCFLLDVPESNANQWQPNRPTSSFTSKKDLARATASFSRTLPLRSAAGGRPGSYGKSSSGALPTLMAGVSGYLVDWWILFDRLILTLRRSIGWILLVAVLMLKPIIYIYI